MHPELAAAHEEQWLEREKRTEYRLAEIKFYLCQPHSRKALKIESFLPAFARPKKGNKKLDAAAEAQIAKEFAEFIVKK